LVRAAAHARLVAVKRSLAVTLSAVGLALAALSAGCSSLTQPQEITITAEPIPSPNGPPAGADAPQPPPGGAAAPPGAPPGKGG
jgi:hypothetical protein